MYHPVDFRRVGDLDLAESRQEVKLALRDLPSSFKYKLLDREQVRVNAEHQENSRKRKAEGKAHKAQATKNAKKGKKVQSSGTVPINELSKGVEKR